MKSFLLLLSVLLVIQVCVHAQQGCASYQYLQQEIRNNPGLNEKITRAENSSNIIRNEVIAGVNDGSGANLLPIVKIPVVVHVLYRTADQNISDAQILSQIAVLNQEFRLNHADTSKIPMIFRSLAADCRIEFVLATITPKGYSTKGIVRKKTDSYSFGFDDKIKFSSSGGDDAWDSDRYLNIWVSNLTLGLNGYSSVLGGPKEKDGVVLRYDVFGTTGVIKAPYTKGRVAVHEIGHWFGLKHIWGDQVCGSDGVDDTPTQKMATRSCPTSFISSCDNAAVSIMYSNYMDLTPDECLNMFTMGQRDKMRNSLEDGGAHHALLSSNAATATGIPEPTQSSIEPTPVAFSLFPNPTRDVVTIDIKDQSIIGKTITVHNHLGQQVKAVVVTKGTTTINLQSLRDGVYYVRCGQSKAFKVIKTAAAANL